MADGLNEQDFTRPSRTNRLPARLRNTGESGAACGYGAAASADPQPTREVGGSCWAPRLLATLPGFRGGDEEDDDENRSGMQNDRGDDGDGDDATEYCQLLVEKHGTTKANARDHDEGSAESETDSVFEAESASARIEARAVRLQSIGKANTVKEENAASVAALVAKRSPFNAALEKVMASARGYNKWPALVLTRVCTRRALKGLSQCKDKQKLADVMQAQDMEKGRSSPYLDDLPLFMQEESLEPTPVKVIPAGLILALRCVLQSGAKRSPSKKVTWEKVTYLHSDVHAVIDKEDSVTTGIASTMSDGDSSGSGSGRGRSSGSIVQTTDRCVTTGIASSMSDRDSSGSGSGRGRGSGSIVQTTDRCVTTGIASTMSDIDSNGRGRGSGSIVQTTDRKTKHCLMRLVCIMVFDRHRKAAVESKLSANRLQLDGKVVGAKNDFWTGIATDYRDEALHVPNLFSHPLVDDCDPMVLAQPNITSGELSSMWTDAEKAWNPAWGNYDSESGNHAPWHDFCRGDKDTYIVGAAVEMFPELHQVMTNLLPKGVQREDAGTGQGGAVGGAEQRETAKRAGVALYNSTRNGQRKLLKSQRESIAASAVSTAVTDALSSVMADVVMPALTNNSPPASADARARTEESMRKSAALALVLEQDEAHERLSDSLREEEALGESGSSFRKGWLQKKISELEATM